MPSALKQLIPCQFIPLATATLFTADSFPQNAQVQFTSILLCNTTAAAKTLDLYIVPSGGTAAQSNAFFFGNLIPANSTWFITVGGDGVEVFTLPIGAFIAADASAANAITITASGKVYT